MSANENEKRNNMLQVKNIRKCYKTTSFTQVALDGVSIAFRDNEFAAILGPSGSGKTTLLNIIGGLDQYDSGDLIIDGISTKDYKAADWDTFRNNRIGFVFQSYNLIGHQSVLANVELALTLSGVGKQERERRAREVLERVGLRDHIDKKPNQLSGGQMQRVAIARALINDPEILLADEPTGALDSQTSVEIMNLLQEIARDRLVVMVTHNPELADQYATRIVTLRDGHIQGDTDAYNPSAADLARVSSKKIRRASMKFFTALSLSFNNLMSKKGRTIMTAFAGSIGIIGIAAILALSNGVNAYIKKVEEDTLTSYPVTISKSGFDLTSLMGANSSGEGEGKTVGHDSDSDDALDSTVGQVSIVNNMVSKMKNNDLTSLKQFIEGDDGEKLRKNSTYIEYEYGISPIIYVKGRTDSAYRKANPDTSLTSLGMGSASTSNSTMSSMMSTNVFDQLIDQSLVEGSYDVKAGHWPENADECVLVLSEDGQVLDYTLYQLGLRDYNEYKQLVQAVVEEQETNVAQDYTQYSYRDIMNTEMRVVVGADCYTKDETYGVWVDKTEDAAYMNDLLENKSVKLKIAGIVQKKEGETSSVLTSGCIYYTPELVNDTINRAAATEIVHEQQQNKDRDVFSGKDFSDTSSTSNFDMSNLITVDEGAIQAAFKFDADAMTLDLSSLSLDFSAADIGSAGNMSSVASALPPIDEEALAAALSEAMAQSAAGASSAGAGAGGSGGAGGTGAAGTSAGSSAAGNSATSAGSSAASPINQEGLKTLIAALLNDYVKNAAKYPTPEAYLQSNDAAAIFMQYSGGVINKEYMEEAQAAAQEQMMAGVQAGLTKYMASYMETAMTQMAQAMATSMQASIQAAMEKSMSSMMEGVGEQLQTKMANALSIDKDALGGAFKVNMSKEELQGAILAMIKGGTSTYDTNMQKLGYANFDTPTSINIYARDFDAKQTVKDELDAYCENMRAAGDEDKAITYSDIVGTMMEGVRTIIDAISYMLIAFVSISLIVSSIMIGIITYVSVLERTKEIGILRAIGASRRNISQVFNAETILEGLIAGVLGVGVVALLCPPASAIAQMLTDVPNLAQLPPLAAVVLVCISVFLTFIAGLIPAASASRKDPVIALRSE